MKFKHKLSLGFLIIPLLIGITGFYALKISKKSLEESLIQSSHTLAMDINHGLEQRLEDRINLFQEYSQSSLLRKALSDSNRDIEKRGKIQEYINEKDKEWTSVSNKTITRLMQNIIQNNISRELRDKISFYEHKNGHRVFGDIFVTNKYGAIVAMTGITTDYRQDDEEWWQYAQRDSVYITKEIGYDESADMYSLDIGLRINNEKGDFLGIMKIVLNIEDFIGVVRNLANSGIHRNHKSMQYRLLTSEGTLIYSTKSNEKFFDNFSHMLPESEYSPRGDVLGVTLSHYALREDDESIITHGHLDKLKDLAQLNWILMLEHKKDEIFAIMVKLKKQIVTLTISSTLCAILLGFLFSNSLTKSIKKLSKATEKMGKGKFDTDIDIASHDEIGELAQSFKRMADDLKTTTVSRDELAMEIEERKKTELLINQSKQDWEDTFNNITDMVTLHDKDYNILRANKAAEKMLKLPALEKALNVKCFKYYHGTEGPPEGCPSCGCLKTGVPRTFEIFEPFLGKHLEIRAMARLDDNNHIIGLIHVVRDITERKKTENTIKKAKMEWEMTFDNANEIFILLDKDLNIMRANKSFARFTQKPLKQLIGRKCTELIKTDHDHIKQNSKDGKTEIKAHNGQWLQLSFYPIINEHGELLHSLLIGTDITALKKTQQELVQSEEKLKKNIEELEKSCEMAVGRELRMKALKKDLKKLNADPVKDKGNGDTNS
jgi:PAS domain S-box-containing protein